MAIGDKVKALMEGSTTAAMVGAAPAGYGLGADEGMHTSDCNNAILSGWYTTMDSTANAPVDAENTNWVLVGSVCTSARSTASVIHQTFYAWKNSAGAEKNAVLERFCQNGVWSPWEYVNPPMQLGVEYRTTERFCGSKGPKVVYAKTVELSNLVAGHNLVEVVSGVTSSSCIVRQNCSSCATSSYGRVSIPGDYSRETTISSACMMNRETSVWSLYSIIKADADWTTTVRINVFYIKD